MNLTWLFLKYCTKTFGNSGSGGCSVATCKNSEIDGQEGNWPVHLFQDFNWRTWTSKFPKTQKERRKILEAKNCSDTKNKKKVTVAFIKQTVKYHILWHEWFTKFFLFKHWLKINRNSPLCKMTFWLTDVLMNWPQTKWTPI